MCKLLRYYKFNSSKILQFNQLNIKKQSFSQQKSIEILELPGAYTPEILEDVNFNENYFKASNDCAKEKPFTLILPPPNITGNLHLGHALTASIQDAIIKWHKMHGRKTVWIPALDHAGIATQVIVEKKLWKEQQMTRHDLGRENFEKEIWKWMREKSNTIINQLQNLNLSLDWQSENVFTMDDKRSRAVITAFIRLFEQGLIYRADHLVNWSCTLQSAISDIEVNHLPIEKSTKLKVPGYDDGVEFGVLTKFAYKVNESEEEIVVATTRPETMIADVAVAVHPNDTKYSHLIGKKLCHPFRNDLIPIIADSFVDPNYGTGAVKITPAHDPIDFDVGKRHNLQTIQAIDEKGLLTTICENFKGLKRFDARTIIVNQLAERQLFRGNENCSLVVPICSRSQDVVEYLIRPQWFLKTSNLAQKAMDDVRNSQLQIEPQNFEKMWFQWFENSRDWCISRQLWWGHRIPAYFCSTEKKNAWVAAENDIEAKTKAAKLLDCNTSDLQCQQDEDVLDTWFSSALQPFSVFGWPENSQELQQNYPLSLMETGHDILCFWVARMVMLGRELTGELPFNKILLHGIICDVYGRKMSKSLGNVVAPENVIKGSTLDELKGILQSSYLSGLISEEEFKKAMKSQEKMYPNGIPRCGTDALRFTLLSHHIKNHFINFDVTECHTNRLFCNKIWQATKFTLMWCKQVFDMQNAEVIDKTKLNLMDKWILSKLNYMVQSVNKSMENYDFHVATAKLKNFFYYEFCDIYLESIKTNLKEKTKEMNALMHCWTLLQCLDTGLLCLAPFMPLLAQHLHRHLPRIYGIGDSMAFPKYKEKLIDLKLEEDMERVMEVIVGIRRLKKMFNVTYKYKPEVFIYSKQHELIQDFYEIIKDLSNLYTLQHLSVSSNIQAAPDYKIISDSIGDTKIYLLVPITLFETIELDHNKLNDKKQKLQKELDKFNKMRKSNTYYEKVTLKEQELHSKKISSIEEKIARIQYMERLTQ